MSWKERFGGGRSPRGCGQPPEGSHGHTPIMAAAMREEIALLRDGGARWGGEDCKRQAQILAALQAGLEKKIIPREKEAAAATNRQLRRCTFGRSRGSA